MANLLHRLLRKRTDAEPDEASPVPEPVRAAPDEPATDEAPARHDRADYEAKPTPARGRRKTRDETASIGPGEP